MGNPGFSTHGVVPSSMVVVVGRVVVVRLVVVKVVVFFVVVGL